MNRIAVVVMMVLVVAMPLLAGGSQEEVRGAEPEAAGGLSVTVEEGEEYLHRLKVLPLIRIKSPPQLAVWTETADGEFLETLYVTGRAGEQSWRSAPLDKTPADEIRRPESLPVWQHRSKGENLDGRTGATPEGGYEVLARSPEEGRVRLFLEVNHSTDFNESFPKDASQDSPAYSGGPWGSGQPSLVYSAHLDITGGEKSVELELIGHGSPDGSDGEIYASMEGITTAREIIQSARVAKVE